LPAIAKTMKKTIIILTILLNGCGTKTADTVTDNKKDSITQDPDKVVPTTLVNEGEDFNEFFKRFTTDSLFQIERVKFPWTMMIWELDEDAPKKELTNKEEWRFSSFHYDESYATRQIDAYTQETKIYADSAKIELRGVDNGIHIDFEFHRINGQWTMVSEKDYSN
jgi:hypothetical protein